MSPLRKLFIGAFVLAGLAAIAVGFLAFDFLESRPTEVAEPLVFDVAPGMSFKAVAKRLEGERLVTSASRFTLYAKVVGEAAKTRVGEYAIPRNATPREVLQIITSGKSIEHPVTVAEGLNMYDVADVVERAGVGSRRDFLALCADPAFVRELLGETRPSLEGYLFPETYNVTKFTGLKGLIRAMVARFNDVYKQIRLPQKSKLSKHEFVTLASIVEKETGAPEERPIIASVFYNRLALGMKLQTDPTVLYGIMDRTHVPSKNITRADLVTDNRYNTYTRAGLPYGPISNPGKEALQATAKPAATEFLYFVSRNNGTHTFSREYGEHEKAVRALQVNRAAREAGTSWRDLGKRSREQAAAHAAELAKPPARKQPARK